MWIHLLNLNGSDSINQVISLLPLQIEIYSILMIIKIRKLFLKPLTIAQLKHSLLTVMYLCLYAMIQRENISSFSQSKRIGRLRKYYSQRWLFAMRQPSLLIGTSLPFLEEKMVLHSLKMERCLPFINLRKEKWLKSQFSWATQAISFSVLTILTTLLKSLFTSSNGEVRKLFRKESKLGERMWSN